MVNEAEQPGAGWFIYLTDNNAGIEFTALNIA
jgi:hypothetical protein